CGAEEHQLCASADIVQEDRMCGDPLTWKKGCDWRLRTAILVSAVHSAAMIAAGGTMACLVYRYLGLKFVSRSWFNLDATWAFSLVLVGALSLAFSLYSGP